MCFNLKTILKLSFSSCSILTVMQKQWAPTLFLPLMTCKRAYCDIFIEYFNVNLKVGKFWRIQWNFSHTPSGTRTSGWESLSFCYKQKYWPWVVLYHEMANLMDFFFFESRKISQYINWIMSFLSCLIQYFAFHSNLRTSKSRQV